MHLCKFLKIWRKQWINLNDLENSNQILQLYDQIHRATNSIKQEMSAIGIPVAKKDTKSDISLVEMFFGSRECEKKSSLFVLMHLEGLLFVPPWI